jgi:hypothetical protein
MKYEIKVTFESPKVIVNEDFQELLDLVALQVKQYGENINA